MDAVDEPIKIEQFLQFHKYQQVFHFLHFQFVRNADGRLFNKSEMVFRVSFLLDVWFFGINLFDILRSIHLGETSHQNLPVLSISIYFTIRGIIMFIKRHDIVDFLNVLDREFPKDLVSQRVLNVSQVFDRYHRRHGYVGLYANYALPGFCFTPVVTYILTYEDRNAPILLDYQLLGGWLPYDLRQNHLVYPLVWLYDVYCMLVGVTFFTSFYTLFNTMQAQVIMHLDCFCRQLEALNAADTHHAMDERQFYEHICGLIRRHQQLNLICDKFNDIFKLAILITDLVGATSICFHLYLITETQDPLMIVKYILPTLALVVFTFEICLRGTQIEEASSRLNEALYNQNWYMGSKMYRKLILIWIKYAQCTRKLTAYGLVEVNMKHFSDIMQLAYRLFTFLKSRQ
ncbi:odorant receptor 88a [Drosophila novamexicana]|uniref:odorant receptor 88a n=1 Tax=Drosophila novamexicana TaxID=47314 RepID=UPI0011E5C64B|nr:odorant receptor 88a [Drosophila novamexicana]XP_030559158.1 odorant receptor 88a [Drosophila novamexicana]